MRAWRRLLAVACIVLAVTAASAQDAAAETDSGESEEPRGLQCRTYFGMLAVAQPLEPPRSVNVPSIQRDAQGRNWLTRVSQCAETCAVGDLLGVCRVLTAEATEVEVTPARDAERPPGALPEGVVRLPLAGRCQYWAFLEDEELGLNERNTTFEPYAVTSLCPPSTESRQAQLFFSRADQFFLDLAFGDTSDMPCTTVEDAWIGGRRIRDLPWGYSFRSCADICAADERCSHVNYMITLADLDNPRLKNTRCLYMSSQDPDSSETASIIAPQTDFYTSCFKNNYTDFETGQVVQADPLAINAQIARNTLDLSAPPTPPPSPPAVVEEDAAPAPQPPEAEDGVTPTLEEEDDGGGGGGSGVGIGIGVGVGVAVLAALLAFLLWYRRRRKHGYGKAGRARIPDEPEQGPSAVSFEELMQSRDFRLLSAMDTHLVFMKDKPEGYERLAALGPNFPNLVTRSLSSLHTVSPENVQPEWRLETVGGHASSRAHTEASGLGLSVEVPVNVKSLLHEGAAADVLEQHEEGQSLLMLYQLRCQLNTMMLASRSYPQLFSSEGPKEEGMSSSMLDEPWRAPTQLSLLPDATPQPNLEEQLNNRMPEGMNGKDMPGGREWESAHSSGKEAESLEAESGASDVDEASEVASRKLKIMTRLMPVMPDVDLAVDPKHDFKFVRRLGRGAFATVWEAWWTARDGSRKHVALKLIDLENLGTGQKANRAANMKAVKTELEIMTRINHPSVVRCYGGCVRSDMACLILEFMEGGELARFVHRERKGAPLDIAEVLSVGAHIARGLEFLHPLIIHGDLKPQNVLLDAEGHLKLTDFGLSKIKVATMMSSKLGGTPAYTAPEVFGNVHITEKCDIYSLGVVMWECLTGELPWKELVFPLQIMYEVHMKNCRPPLPPDTPPELAQVIQKCWHADPSKRFSASDLVHRLNVVQAGLEG